MVSLRRKKIATFIFMVALIGLLTFFSDIKPVVALRDRVIKIAQPVFLLGTNMKNFVFSLLGKSGNNDTALEREEAIQVTAFQLETMAEENERLKDALEFKKGKDVSLKGARILLYLREFGHEMLLIDQGKDGGVREGDRVVDSRGVLVGTVLEALENSAKVMCVSSPGETYDVEIRSLSTHALAKGMGARTFSLELIPADAALKRGDFVTLSGTHLSRPILVGQITSLHLGVSVAFQEVYAVSLSHPELLKEVFVVLASQKKP